MIIKFAKNNLGYIGKDGGLPWKCKADLQAFKEATTGQVLIMGRKTFESIGKPLPNRMNIVITDNEDYAEEMNRKYVEQRGILFVKGLSEGIRTATYFTELYETRIKDLYVIGGAGIIESVLREYPALVTRIEISVINDKTKGDTQVSEVLLNKHQSKIVYQYRDHNFETYREII